MVFTHKTEMRALWSALVLNLLGLLLDHFLYVGGCRPKIQDIPSVKPHNTNIIRLKIPILYILGLNASWLLEIWRNIAFARGGAHLPIAHALRLLLDEIEIEKK